MDVVLARQFLILYMNILLSLACAEGRPRGQLVGFSGCFLAGNWDVRAPHLTFQYVIIIP